MSELNEPAPSARRNPLIWIVLVVVGLILFVLLGGDRGDRSGQSSGGLATQQPAENTVTVETDTDDQVAIVEISPSEADLVDDTAGTIERTVLLPPGMRARQYIEQLREAGKPYPLAEAFDKAEMYRTEGSLADAHLLLFFAARENHLPAVMALGEMADPTRFRAEESLLDQADPLQAYKWYSKASELGQEGAAERLVDVESWARDAATRGDEDARQLLLSIR